LESMKKPWQHQTEKKVEKKVEKKPEVDTYKAYKDNLAQLEKLFTYGEDFRRFYGDRGVSAIKKAYDICKRDLDQLMKVDSVKCPGDDVSAVKQAINVIVDVVLTNKITPFIRDTSLHMGRLIFNWNDEVAKVGDIRRLAITAQRVAVGYMSILEAIEVQRKLLEMLRKELRNKPPAYELSKHLLKTLDED